MGMRKLKTMLVLMLTGVIFAFFAVLPRLAGAFSDDRLRGQSGSASIQSVALELHDMDSDAPGYMLRKLALERFLTSVPITPQQASMTEEEAIAAAQAGMDIYVDAGIFEWFDCTYQGAEPYFCLEPSDKSRHMIFWSVIFINEASPYQSLLLHIDDETGKIIYIKYEDYGPTREFANAEAAEQLLDRFIHAFLSPLSLLPSQLETYENLEGSVSRETTHYINGSDVIFTYRDAQYGDVYIVLTVTSTGFYSTFPMMSVREVPA